MADRKMLSDDQLENVSGGLMDFNQETGILTWYKTEQGASLAEAEQVQYTVLNHDRAFSLSNQWHTSGYTEEEIINGLIKRELIK